MKKGYGMECDWWSVGAIAFEMMARRGEGSGLLHACTCRPSSRLPSPRPPCPAPPQPGRLPPLLLRRPNDHLPQGARRPAWLLRAAAPPPPTRTPTPTHPHPPTPTPTPMPPQIVNWRSYLRFPPEAEASLSPAARDLITCLLSDVEDRLGTHGVEVRPPGGREGGGHAVRCVWVWGGPPHGAQAPPLPPAPPPPPRGAGDQGAPLLCGGALGQPVRAGAALPPAAHSRAGHAELRAVRKGGGTPRLASLRRAARRGTAPCLRPPFGSPGCTPCRPALPWPARSTSPPFLHRYDDDAPAGGGACGSRSRSGPIADPHFIGYTYKGWEAVGDDKGASLGAGVGRRWRW